MLNRILSFMNKPRSLPKPQSPFELGKVVLDELADCKRRLDELEKPSEVQTHYAEDHEEIEINKKNIYDLYTKLRAVLNRVEHLEEEHFKTLTRSITAPHWQKQPRIKGRFAKPKRGDGNVSV